MNRSGNNVAPLLRRVSFPFSPPLAPLITLENLFARIARIARTSNIILAFRGAVINYGEPLININVPSHNIN